MDKQTLSHYGWIVIVVLVLAVMLAFATPFGTYVGDAVVATTKGFGSITEHNLNEDSIKEKGDVWEDKLENGIENGDSSQEGNDKVKEISIYFDETVIGEEGYIPIKFEEGMTWGEWMESEYNTFGAYESYDNLGGIDYTYIAIPEEVLENYKQARRPTCTEGYVKKDDIIIDSDDVYTIKLWNYILYADEYANN